ncbi:MAG TPA: alpha/beta hydrolase [Vicinamibacterales bacterium]|nr:alpha/beta hydrolase [Vicinamibacterales bacterium]
MRSTAVLVLMVPALLGLSQTSAGAQAADATGDEVVLLWPGGAPGAVGDGPEDRPQLAVVRPEAGTANGTAIIVCPGGAYGRLAMEHEGRDAARLFASRGVTAFLLTYRLGPRYRHPAMLQDVLQAIRIVRRDAAAYGVKPDRIGVIGFSAGGHLASSAATLFDAPEGRVDGMSPDVSARPDFVVLAYPVIVMGEAITHAGSQRNLLGENPPAPLIERLSTDRQVGPQTPPTFLFHTTEDTGVPPENSVRFYLALRKAGVPAEMHIYERGRHGVGLALQDPVLRTWTDRMFDWMGANGW